MSVSDSVFRWVINRSRLPIEELENKFPKLPLWIEGEAKPTFRQVEELAKATLTPFGYFFLAEPPMDSLPIPLFRTDAAREANRASSELLATVSTMERRQAWMRDYLIDRGNDPLPIVGSFDTSAEPVSVAEQLRHFLGITNNWASEFRTWREAFRQLIDVVQSAGILVSVNSVLGNNTHVSLDVSEFRGFVLVDEYAPLIFINGSDGKAAQMFTLAHEIAHIFFGSSAAFDLRNLEPADDKVEVACNRVAAEFLVAEIELREQWKYVKSESNRYQLLARHFKVSEIVVARRLLDVQLITRKEFLGFYKEYMVKDFVANQQKEQGGSFLPTQNFRLGWRFGQAVVSAVKSGDLLYQDAYRLTGLRGDSFEKFAGSMG